MNFILLFCLQYVSKVGNAYVEGPVSPQRARIKIFSPRKTVVRILVVVQILYHGEIGTRQRHQPGGKARVSAAQLFRKEPTKPELASCDSLAPFVLTSDNVALTATMQIRNCGY